MNVFVSAGSYTQIHQCHLFHFCSNFMLRAHPSTKNIGAVCVLSEMIDAGHNVIS